MTHSIIFAKDVLLMAGTISLGVFASAIFSNSSNKMVEFLLNTLQYLKLNIFLFTFYQLGLVVRAFACEA